MKELSTTRVRHCGGHTTSRLHGSLGNRRQVRGRALWNRNASIFLLLSSCCFVGILPPIAAESFIVSASRFLQDEALTKCNESILMADKDANGQLNSVEYTSLISILTDGLLDVDDFADLPLRLRTVYHMTACACTFEPRARSDCCVGDNSNIPIDDIESETPTTANLVFCAEVARGIEDVADDFASPTAIPAISPSSEPTEQSMGTVSPSSFPPLQAPTTTPSQIAPTQDETLCVGFQYEIINDLSLSADDIMNEVDNSIKDGLIEASRTTVINILNETYPRSDGGARGSPNKMKGPRDKHSPISSTHQVKNAGQVMVPDGRHRKLLMAVEQADALVLDMDLATYRSTFQDEIASQWNTTRQARRLIQDQASIHRSRRLVYYSDEYPVEITMIVDNAVCPGGIVDDSIRCAVVSSTLCLVLEPGDDPAEIRQVIVDGLSESFANGDFVNNIPSGRSDW